MNCLRYIGDGDNSLELILIFTAENLLNSKNILELLYLFQKDFSKVMAFDYQNCKIIRDSLLDRKEAISCSLIEGEHNYSYSDLHVDAHKSLSSNNVLANSISENQNAAHHVVFGTDLNCFTPEQNYHQEPTSDGLIKENTVPVKEVSLNLPQISP